MKTTRPVQWRRKSLDQGESSRLVGASAGKASIHVGHQIRLGSLFVDVERVAIGAARAEMPTLIRDSTESGRAFLIHNAKSPSAATALLINPAVLEQRLLHAKPRRTLGDVIDTLPFKRRGAPRLVVSLPDDDAPTLRVPGCADASPQRSQPVRQSEVKRSSRSPEGEAGT